jgi:hypothetical protein
MLCIYKSSLASLILSAFRKSNISHTPWLNASLGAIIGEVPYSVPVRRALYGEDHTVAGLLGDYLWGWGA